MNTAHTALPVPPFPPMEARTARELPTGAAWQYEPKWDGFRCLAFRRGDEVYLQSKSKPLARYFPEIVRALLAMPDDDFVVDGELVVDVAGALSFDALLQRLHPAASRVQTLSNATPATYLVFDLLAWHGESLVDDPLVVRRARLDTLISKFPAHSVRVSPCSYDAVEAMRWFDTRRAGIDGVMAKLIDAPYLSGARDAMVKVKRQRTADCVVGGFRFERDTRVVGSLLLGLYDEHDLLHHVGFTATFGAMDRVALTRELGRLRGAPGFTGRAPGGPSRWTHGEEKPWYPLRPELVVEVGYDHAAEQRFRHGTTLLRRRPDKPALACRMEQLAPDAGSDRV